MTINNMVIRAWTHVKRLKVKKWGKLVKQTMSEHDMRTRRSCLMVKVLERLSLPTACQVEGPLSQLNLRIVAKFPPGVCDLQPRAWCKASAHSVYAGADHIAALRGFGGSPYSRRFPLPCVLSVTWVFQLRVLDYTGFTVVWDSLGEGVKKTGKTAPTATPGPWRKHKVWVMSRSWGRYSHNLL